MDTHNQPATRPGATWRDFHQPEPSLDFDQCRKGEITSVQWLEDFLRSGPRTTLEIREAAAHAGFSWGAMQRARDMLDGYSSKPGFWALPQTRASPASAETSNPIAWLDCFLADGPKAVRLIRVAASTYGFDWGAILNAKYTLNCYSPACGVWALRPR